MFLLLGPMLFLEQVAAATNTSGSPSVTSPAMTASGIRGVVVRWPVRPSSRIGETNSAPMPNMIVSVQSASGGTEIARHTTDKNGRFQFNVSPGKYVIVPVPQAGSRVLARKQTVEVKENAMVDVVLTCDTGIR